MNRFNSSSFFRIGLAALTISILVTSCAPDNEEDITLPRDKFIGTWSMSSHHTDPNQATNQSWDLSIESYSADGEQVMMRNFDWMGSDKAVRALVNGNNLIIQDTTINLNGGSYQTINGTGSLNGATLSFNYTSFDGITTDTATASGTEIQ